MIADFHSLDYRFLSNFHPAPVEYRGLIYPTVEHAYQAAKTLHIEQRKVIQAAASPAQAKKLGRTVTLRKDWDAIKLNVMEFLLREKFKSGSNLAAKLIATNPHQLIEGNDWGDRYWGCVFVGNAFVGQNHLGKLLSKVRKDLLTEKLFA